ncbi:MAG: extracellular solute-binding protein [Planctomycetota bacterium]|jgi:multiple sugar transport system substrate-binding protein
MKWVFGGGIAVFLALYVYALTLDPPPKPGITTIRWATDPNPARDIQTKEFSKLYPGIRVVVEPGDRQKIIVQCATGVGPDVIDVYGQTQMLSYVDAGILLDLTPYAEEMGFSPEHTYPAIRDLLMVDGKQYRFPCNLWANCVIYNKAIFDDHGVPYPRDGWTYDEFVETAKRIKNDPSTSGKEHMPVARLWPGWLFRDIFVGHGGRMFTPDGLVCTLDSAEGVAAAKLYHDMTHVHDILPSPAEAAAVSSQGGWGAGGINWFLYEQAAMVNIGRWYLCRMIGFRKLKGKIGAVTIPRVAGRTSQGQCGTRAAGVNVKGRHIDESLKFLQFLAGPEYSRCIVLDGDSLPPSPEVARTGEDLVNKIVEDPAFHAPFIEAMKNSRPLDTSLFISATLVDRWLGERMDGIENGRPAEEAMRSVADEINKRIRQNLERRPDLQRKFKKVTGREWTPDWWRER